MVKLHRIPAAGALLMCVLALAAPQALAHEFEGSSAVAQTTSSTTNTQEFRFGSGTVIRCTESGFEYTPLVGLFPTLSMTIKKLALCKLNFTEEVGAGPNGCELVLSSAGLFAVSTNFFTEGSLGIKCGSALGFETVHCGITIGTQTPLTEYEWANVTTSPFNSTLGLVLKNIKYTVTGTGCGTTGGHSNGEWRGVVDLLTEVIVK